MLRLALGLTFLAACGKGPDITISAPGLVPQSLAELCSAEAHLNIDGSYTATGCPFIQQEENIRHNGVASGETAADASGAPIGTIQYSCERWMLGADPSGTSIILNTQTGEAISHGLVHPGEPISVLSSPIALPYSLSPASEPR
jgi:hypothetical protein